MLLEFSVVDVGHFVINAQTNTSNCRGVQVKTGPY